MNTITLGVDIGGVIIDRVNDDKDTSFFSDNYLNTTPVPGVFEALRQLVDQRFGNHVFLVSKCGKRVQERTLRWLDHHHFYGLTGIEPSHVHFCRERHEKAGICEELKVTHFVDDRLEVLSYLEKVRMRYLFQPDSREVKKFSRFLGQVIQVHSWKEILEHELA